VKELRTRGAVELGTEATKELNTGASEEVSAGASEELTPDLRLLQKIQDSKSKRRREIQCNRNMKNNSPPHDEGYFIILFFLSQGHQSTC